MDSCSQCGRRASPDDRFCPGCGNFLDWEDEQLASGASGGAAAQRGGSRPLVTDPPLRRDGPEPRGRPADQPPQDAARHGVALAVPTEPVAVTPGGTATAQVHVRNTGTLVDEFLVEVDGSAQAWTEVEPTRVAVYPGNEEPVTLTFRPPRDASVRAGEAPYHVVARSALHDGTDDRQPGLVDVGRFDDLTMSLAPHEAEARRTTAHRVTLVNRGNAETPVELSGADRQGELDLRVAPAVLRVPPGGEATALVQARARRERWHGDRVRRPFTVEARADSGQRLTADGVSVQQPVLALRALVALALAVLVVLAAAVGLLWLSNRPVVPDVRGLSVADAERRLAADRLEAVPGPPVVTAQVPRGSVVETDPAPGARAWFSDEVEVRVATRRLVQVPPVLGQPVQAAVQALNAVGLRFELREQESDGNAGTVLESEPEAGEEVEEGRVVTLTVAVERTLAVPDVVGDPVEEAIQALQAEGLQVQVQRQLSDRPVGTVLATDPGPGEEIATDGVVTLLVAGGVEVPDLVGQRLTQARQALAQLQLSSEAEGPFLDEERGICRAEADLGNGLGDGPVVGPGVIAIPVPCMVQSQEPVSGSEVPLGGVVQLEVGAGG